MKKTQEKFNKLPIYYDYDDEQYNKLLSDLGITDEEARNGALLSLPGDGIIKASDEDLVIGTFNKFWEARNKAIEEDLTGDGFIYGMFLYELRNHEFIITQDPAETLETLGISEEKLNNSEPLQKGLAKAIETINATDLF